MRISPRFVLTLVLALQICVMLLVLLTQPTLARGDGASREGSGLRPGADAAHRLITGTLDTMRQKPEQREAMLRLYQEKALRFGGADNLQGRMARIRRIVDEAMALDDGGFQSRAPQMAAEIWRLMNGA